MIVKAEAVAVKRVIAFQLEETMVKRMNTSRSLINHLDPLNTSITLATIESAVAAMGKRFQLQFV